MTRQYQGFGPLAQSITDPNYSAAKGRDVPIFSPAMIAYCVLSLVFSFLLSSQASLKEALNVSRRESVVGNLVNDSIEQLEELDRFQRTFRDIRALEKLNH
jgi:hypothetical protein